MFLLTLQEYRLSEMIENANFNNNFLIAMPGLADPNFFRAVVYICEHNEDGAIGIIINRPTTITLADVLADMNIPSQIETHKKTPILFGGPVHQEHGFVLHRPNGVWRSTLEAGDDIAVTSSRDILEAIARGQGPSDLIISLGYAGWGAGQLEQEIANNFWLNCKAQADLVFHIPFEARWEAAAKLMGVNVQMISGDVGHG